MKRSAVNSIIKNFEKIIEKHGFVLPPFCRWTPDEWQAKGREYDEIRDNMLGWDVTDYGKGDFEDTGLALITLRNGSYNNSKYPKPYAEKLLLSQENQITPMHFHFNKMEDIINRGGGNLMIELYNSTPDGAFADTDIRVLSDGRSYTVPSGTVVRLTPGESITLYQGLYHKFWAEEGFGPVLIGEVSMCNDDKTDNRFYSEVPRFSVIEEDEPPYRLLCNEYPAAK
ncbi:MAG: D-lyxose/D-mannose family sugar isomerase [Oscillospiraceae bacterium]|nr:D-lyxose/D-mannose family sugar isomerase [Oscillospiraceae bacterium]